VVLSDEQLKQWHHDEGKSITEIARILNVNHAAIHQAFKHRDIQIMPRKSMKGVMLAASRVKQE